MKKLLFFTSVFISFQVSAQKETAVKLVKGQTLTAILTANTKANMGLEITSTTNSTDKLIVYGEDEKNYFLIDTLKKMKAAMSAMGIEKSYDSESPEKGDPGMEKSFSKKLNKGDSVFINKTDGSDSSNKVAVTIDTESASGDPIEAMLDMISNSNTEQVTSNAFFIVPKGLKAGESWIDSSDNDGVKLKRTYKIESLNDNIAKVHIIMSSESNITQDNMGSSMTVNLKTNITGDIMVDTKNSLVSEKILVTEVTGEIEAMGQSIPVTSKTTNTYTYTIN